MWQKIRRIGIEIYAFVTAPFVLKNCLSMLGVMTGLLILTLWWLKCYTHHGESVETPDFIGLNFREASKKARSRDFNVNISDSLYVPGKAPGEVLMQNPKPGSRVKESRTIYFTISKNNPDIVKLPDLTGGDDYDLYSKKLSRLGVKPRIVARISDPRLEPNTIVAIVHKGDTITRKIKYGYSIEMGATLDFVVSDATRTTVNTPDCVCQTFDAAKFLLQTAGLTLGTVIPDGTVTDKESAYVWKQTPKFEPEGIMRTGETVDLYLTANKPATCPQ
jgi:UDP-N-acetylmuramate--alanine ligase